METIFDHNVTPEEVENITGFNLSKERYLKHYKTQIDCYTSIYYLYKIRGDEKKAQEYLDKIPNSFHKTFSTSMFDIQFFSKCGKKLQ